MGVDLIFKIAAIGILVVVLSSLLESSNRKEMALMVTLAGLVLILMMVIKEIALLFNTVKTLFNLS